MVNFLITTVYSPQRGGKTIFRSAGDSLSKTVTEQDGMAADSIYLVRFSSIRKYIKSQGILFLLINIYLFMEYVRPQSLYPALDVMPFTQIFITVTIILVCLSRETLRNNIGNSLISAFSIVVVLSSIFAMSPTISFRRLTDYLAWVIIYFLITIIVNTKERLFVYILCFLVYNFKMSQFSFKNWALSGFGYSDWGTGGGPGWFHNSGEFGIQMCIFLPISLYFLYALKPYWPKWKQIIFFILPLTALTGTISSSSRGALVGAGAVIFWMFLKSRYKFRGLLILTVVAVLVWRAVPPEQKARFESAGTDKTSLNRTERWKKGMEMANRYPLLGVGYANWGVADGSIFGGNGSLSHNIFIECISELGYTGLVIFLALIAATFANNRQTRKLISKVGAEGRFLYYLAHGLDCALIGYLVSGCFVTVMYYPYFWINLSFTVALNNVAKLESQKS